MIEPHRVAETAAFVASLPRASVVVFVFDKADACLVRDLRTSMHGTDAMASTHVLVAPTEADEALLMLGRPSDIPAFREPILVERRNMAAMSVVGDMADEPRVPRREPAPSGTCSCGYRGPGWCSAMLCGRRPVETEFKVHVSGDAKAVAGAVSRAMQRRYATASLEGQCAPFLAEIGEERRAAIEAGAAEIIAEQTAREQKAPVEISLGSASQIMDLIEAGFTYTEASSLPDAERDLYAQLVKERAAAREPRLLGNILRPGLAYA